MHTDNRCHRGINCDLDCEAFCLFLVFAANKAGKSFERWACLRVGEQRVGNAASVTETKSGEFIYLSIDFRFPS